METAELSIAEHWDRRACLYGDSLNGYKAICSYGAPYFYNKYIDIIHRKAFFRMLSYVPIKGKKFLDVGCGVGRWCRILSARGADVTGADISKEMIIRAKSVPANGRVSFINEPISGIPIPSHYLDAVTCITVLQHVTDKAEFKRSVANITRMIKKGGKILVMEVAPSARNINRRFNNKLSVRTENDYISAFKEAGASLEDVFSVDIMPIKQYVISRSKDMPKSIFYILLHTAILLSLAIDCLFSGTRFFRNLSWHKAFIFNIM